MFLLILASAVFGLSVGLYDFLLPLFLDHAGMSYGKMGIIFSFSAIFLFFIRAYAGHISDIIGRKYIFSLSLFFCGIATLFTPFFPYVVPQIILRSLRESSRVVKETMQQLLVFDKWKESFRHFFAWIGGVDFTFQGIGTLLGGFLLLKIGYSYSFVFPGIVVLLVFMLFLFKFKGKNTSIENPEVSTGNNSSTMNSFSWSSPFRHRLPRPLFLMALSAFIFGVGVSISHSFIMPLFFYHKFAISFMLVSVIIAFHRLSLGLPMILAGKIVKWNLKRTMIIFIVVQGIFTVLTAIPASFIAAAVMWLMHDFVGASLWAPARNTLIQHHARDESRGLDVGMVLAWQGLGWIFGPLIAGVVSKYSINYPFLFSGVIIVLSVIPLFWLDYTAKKPLSA